MTVERDRIESMRGLADPPRQGAWYRWGPYLSERAWGTVREDYSADGAAWSAFPHDHARSRTYRWNEDGMAGLSDHMQRLCWALALWNGRDPILKERMFGLTGQEGNHGEDVKECWWYLDAVPSHSWLRWRYHYPQQAFPYEDLVLTNRARGRQEDEYELLDTGVFDAGMWVVEVDHAKADPTDIRTRIRIRNAGPATDTLHVLPTLWFRDIWSWGSGVPRPALAWQPEGRLVLDHGDLGRYVAEFAPAPDGRRPVALACDNATNAARMWGAESTPPYPKDGIGDHVIHGAPTVNPAGTGTKAAAWYAVTLAPGETAELRMRLATDDPGALHEHAADALGIDFDELMRRRLAEADAFYDELAPDDATPDEQLVMRQAFAGMIWGKQYYRYRVDSWLDGDPSSAPPPSERHAGRNRDWRHLDAADVISMPDPWEYPWFAAWDLAFHAVTLAHVDPLFAKEQLLLMCREWYMHPNGQLAAYEWAFGDVNPPVHAWAALAVYRIDGSRDRTFLARIFHKLMLNFTWWVNRKDAAGDNLFEGGFLGLDNIGPFDRSNLPPGWLLEQADGTGWMAAYALWMLEIALELAADDPAYEDVGVKFFEHFAGVAGALNKLDLWDPGDGFFYDRLRLPDGRSVDLRVRSIAGLVPIVATALIDRGRVTEALEFARHAARFIAERKPEGAWFGVLSRSPHVDAFLVSVVDPERGRQILDRVFDPERFLSRHGIRSLSREHLAQPVRFEVDGVVGDISYEPGESPSGMFGGNSNWRGPVWFPLNILILEALDRYRMAAPDDLELEYPRGSGARVRAAEVADDLYRRLVSLFVPGPDGLRPADGRHAARFRDDPDWRGLITYYEYFHGDTGAGLGASHQTGWTGLVAHLIVEHGRPSTAHIPAGGSRPAATSPARASA